MNFGWLKRAILKKVIIINKDPKTPEAATTCKLMLVSGKTPTPISEIEAKTPRIIPIIKKILLHILDGFHW